jgi:hypothetical protein
MFKHILKKKEIVLDCFTKDTVAYDYAKIQYGYQTMPQWWKDMPNGMINRDGKEIPTIKACRALRKHYERAIVMPLWGDLNLKLTSEKETNHLYEWSCANKNFNTNESHNDVGFEGYTQGDGFNIKFSSPWLFKSKSNIEYVVTQPTWSNRELTDNLVLLPGVVDFKYQFNTNVNFFCRKQSKTVSLNIPAQTPITMYYPLTEDKVIIRNHLVNDSEFNRIHQDFGFFSNTERKDFFGLYNRRKQLIDSSEEVKIKPLESSCPFKPK